MRWIMMIRTKKTIVIMIMVEVVRRLGRERLLRKAWSYVGWKQNLLHEAFGNCCYLSPSKYSACDTKSLT